MRTLDELLDTLEGLEGRSYKAYKDIRGRYDAGWFGLDVLYVQGDPFAAPSRVEIRLSNEEAGFPDWAFSSPARLRALCDWIHRRLERAAPRGSRRLGTGKGGQLGISRASQKVLARTSVQWKDAGFAIRLSVGLPARGRRIMGRAAADLFAEQLPDLIEGGACFTEGDAEGLRRHVETVEDAAAMRDRLRDHGLIAFVADGAILP
ncbi:MAG: ATPase, partial [Verrucomicrobia bacterium]|nr:ATPase [Verrucomicrobiota bacterium]